MRPIQKSRLWASHQGVLLFHCTDSSRLYIKPGNYTTLLGSVSELCHSGTVTTAGWPECGAGLLPLSVPPHPFSCSLSVGLLIAKVCGRKLKFCFPRKTKNTPSLKYADIKSGFGGATDEAFSPFSSEWMLLRLGLQSLDHHHLLVNNISKGGLGLDPSFFIVPPMSTS